MMLNLMNTLKSKSPSSDVVPETPVAAAVVVAEEVFPVASSVGKQSDKDVILQRELLKVFALFGNISQDPSAVTVESSEAVVAEEAINVVPLTDDQKVKLWIKIDSYNKILQDNHRLNLFYSKIELTKVVNQLEDVNRTKTKVNTNAPFLNALIRYISLFVFR